MNELFFLFVFVVLSTLFALAAIIAGFVCSVKSPCEEKSSTYECGMKLFSDARLQFDIKFLNYAILFLVFDVETIFLFPFAIAFSQLKLFALIEAFIFVFMLLFALIYAAKTKMLRWF